MKKIVFALLMAIVFSIGCNSSDGSKAKLSEKDSLQAKPTIVQENNTGSNGKPIHLTKQTFLTSIMDFEKNPNEWIYKGELPGIVDFYADWCRPCKITSPILDELSEEYKGKIHIYKVNVDEERELAALFGVQSIPTFLFMPLTGKPTISSGIAQTPEETKEMFKKQIEEILLSK